MLFYEGVGNWKRASKLNKLHHHRTSRYLYQLDIMATAASGVQLGVPDVVVDEEMSHNTDLVPDFDQEREMYGKPRRVKMGDLEKYVTANYKEAQSNSGRTI